jgi:hypothetical protein
VRPIHVRVVGIDRELDDDVIELWKCGVCQALVEVADRYRHQDWHKKHERRLDAIGRAVG